MFSSSLPKQLSYHNLVPRACQLQRSLFKQVKQLAYGVYKSANRKKTPQRHFLMTHVHFNGCLCALILFYRTREVKHHVYVKRQTRICTRWLSFLFTCRLMFIVSSPKVVSFTQFFIHNNCFELFLSALFLFWEILNLNRSFAVYVKPELFIVREWKY